MWCRESEQADRRLAGWLAGWLFCLFFLLFRPTCTCAQLLDLPVRAGISRSAYQVAQEEEIDT